MWHRPCAAAAAAPPAAAACRLPRVPAHRSPDLPRRQPHNRVCKGQRDVFREVRGVAAAAAPANGGAHHRGVVQRLAQQAGAGSG
jgi:hypothetical protein